MNVSSILNEQVDHFVANQSSVEDFEHWFFDSLWEVELSADEGEKKAFYRIEGILAEASHAHWSREALQKELAAAIRPFGQAAREFVVQRPTLSIQRLSASANRSHRVLAQVS